VCAPRTAARPIRAAAAATTASAVPEVRSRDPGQRAGYPMPRSEQATGGGSVTAAALNKGRQFS
jgi:hypothetical protein